MAVFKCKLCGGTIEVKDSGIGVCDSCGTKQTIPNTNDERKMNLLDRANHFRMQNDFDKAMSIYEQVLEEDTTDSDIYYSIALCRYGITYVDDPKTKKKIPTINRMQKVKFTEDADFVMAVKYAEPEQAKFYNEEGEYLDKVQQGIMDITKNEKPYDVFICYKETDDNGERTRDSVLANDLYHGLTNEGFKVFFARITLEGKLGVAYEPYIFAALQSSKVMVVLGTKKEYFNAVWVKNEWSRYISLMNEGENKTLIPAFRDMDPYDLPDEFSNLQALDMSKIGFMQDLIRCIKKLTGKTETINVNVSSGNHSDDKATSLLKRIKVFLNDRDFKKVTEYCEKVLDVDAENSDAYYYKFMAEMKCSNEDELAGLYLDFDDVSNNFRKAVEFADKDREKYLCELEAENLYKIAKYYIKQKRYKVALKKLERISNYMDSEKLINDCKEKIEKNIKNSAVRNKKIKEIIVKVAVVLIVLFVGFKIVTGISNSIKSAVQKAQQSRLEKIEEESRRVEEESIMKVEEESRKRVEESRKAEEESRNKEEEKKQAFIDVFNVYPQLVLQNTSTYTIVDDLRSVSFGSYPQSIDGETKEPIEWIILDVDLDNRKALLLSKYILDNKSFNNKKEKVIWETCDLRKWLNDYFYNISFNSSEKERILISNIINNGNPKYGSGESNNTDDYIFCLSADEVNKYLVEDFQDRRSATRGTEYAKNIKNGKEQMYVQRENYSNDWTEGNSSYWLRTTGITEWNCMCIGPGGGKANSTQGFGVEDGNKGVRPAMWVSY